MKKKLIFFGILIFSHVLFAQNISFSYDQEYLYKWRYLFAKMDYFFKDENDIVSCTIEKDIWFYNYKKQYSIQNGCGFNYVTIQTSDFCAINKNFILEGRMFFVLDNHELNFQKESLTSEEQELEKQFFEEKYNGKYHEKYHRRLQRYFILDDGIKNIKSSSSLIKENIVYSPANLKDRLYFDDFLFFEDSDKQDYHGLLYDSITPPWTEGVAGYGIDEYLICEFNNSIDEIQILNGFVDFRRPALYKQYSRVKKFLIECENPKFSKEYFLEDEVKFSNLKLPQKAKQVKISIKEVYKGEKYEDTCLSAIIATDSKANYEWNVDNLRSILKKEIYVGNNFNPPEDIIKMIR